MIFTSIAERRFGFIDVFVIDDSAYSNMDEKTKQNTTVKLLLWFLFVLCKRGNGEYVYEMLRSFYEANDLSSSGTMLIPTVERHEAKPEVLMEGSQTSTGVDETAKTLTASVYLKN